MRAIPLLCGLCLAALPAQAHSDVTLPALISDHAVLQKSPKTALWGKASPGEKVAAALDAARGEAAAGADGTWRMELDLSQEGAGPFDLVVEGNNQITVSDVMVGEVWVASGQSNMEFPLERGIGGAEEIAASANPQIRQFLVASGSAPAPQADCKGTWTVAGTATSGKFSAVGYYFAKSLQHTLHTPVGLIHSSLGGTPIESWISADAIDNDADLKASKERISRAAVDFPGLKAGYVAAFHAWAEKYHRADAPSNPISFADPKAATADWQPVTFPGKFATAGLPDAGAVWIRKSVPLHGSVATGAFPLPLSLGTPGGFETVYYNGKKIAALTPDTYEGVGSRHVYYPGGSVEGDNVIAVRIYNPAGNAGLDGSLSFYTASLKGEWLAKAEYELPPLDDEAKQAYPQAPAAIPPSALRPSFLYNNMIAPLLPGTIQGVIWYQGENNVARAHQYQTSFPLLIADWRKRWGRDFPFYFCQLSNYGPKSPEPGDSSWAELREAQTQTLSMPGTGEAVLMDLGETQDIHFRNKKEAGERLALVALNKTYGQPAPCSGPVYDSQRIEGSNIRLTFRELNGGLVAKPLPAQYIATSLQNKTLPLVRNSPGSELEGFAICDEDRKWVWADARIENDTVVVSSPTVPKPVAVRYAWADSPTANLYNQAGLPAGSFRTDAFPGVTEKNKF